MNIEQHPPSPQQLADLYRQAGWLEQPEQLDLKRSIQNSSTWFVAKDEDVLVGGVRLQTDYVRYCAVYDLLVLPAYHRQGIGSALMEAALGFCDQHQVQIVHLWPSRGKIGFYQRFGFQPLSDRHPIMIRSQFYPID